MTITNLFKRLQGLQPADPLLTAQITADLGDGLVLVTQPGGGVQQLRNPTGLAVGQWVYFQGRQITGEAPDLPETRIEI